MIQGRIVTTTCKSCGHTAAGYYVQTLVDLIRRTPGRFLCPVLVDGGGNGWVGGNDPCDCADPSHSPLEAK